MTMRTWFGAVVLLFAWGFVMHGAGLVLHEVGGHGVAGTIFGCGIDRIALTYFGGGVVHYVPCTRGWTTLVIIDWAGLALTIGAGAVAMAFQRRAGLAPLTRLLLALLATGFLLGQLAYATSGGFHDLQDPARTALALGAHGLHVLAWLPPLVLFAASALVGARAIVDAFREHFGSRTRLHALKQIAATLGAAGLLYFVAIRLEWAIRSGIVFLDVASTAERFAAVRHEAPPFPIERVLFAIAVAAFVIALARPVPRENAARGAALGAISRRHATFVAAAALVCFVAITLVVRVWSGT